MSEITRNEKANLLAEMLEANKNANSVNIKGKDYVTVNERVKAFRNVYPFGAISTEIISVDENSCLMKATITNNEGVVLATGHSFEDRGSSYINKTSYIENAETSAVGRALGLCGFGVDAGVASANEVAIAQTQQSQLPCPSEEELRTAYATVINSHETQKIHGKPLCEVVPAFGTKQRQMTFLKKYFIDCNEVTDQEKEAAKVIYASISNS